MENWITITRDYADTHVLGSPGALEKGRQGSRSILLASVVKKCRQTVRDARSLITVRRARGFSIRLEDPR